MDRYIKECEGFSADFIIRIHRYRPGVGLVDWRHWWKDFPSASGCTGSQYSDSDIFSGDSCPCRPVAPLALPMCRRINTLPSSYLEAGAEESFWTARQLAGKEGR